MLAIRSITLTMAKVQLPKALDHRGFTLVELLVAVAIIMVLAAIAIPQFAAYRQRANDAVAESDLRSSITAQEAYFVDHSEYKDCVSPFDCELTLPGFTASKDNAGNYAVVPFRHFGALDLQNFTATATHTKGTKTFNYDSMTGVLTN